MIVKDLRPFSIVKDAGFQGLMKHIVPQYNIPSRRYFVENEFGELGRYLNYTRAKLISSIRSVKQLSELLIFGVPVPMTVNFCRSALH